MKKLWTALFILSVFACQKKQDEFATRKSVGNTNSISVFIDDNLWIGEIGDSIRKKFAAPVDGLPQEEPLFTLNQYTPQAFDGKLLKSRNVIFIKKETKNFFEVAQNQYAIPQNVIKISANSTAGILHHLSQNSDAMVKLFQATETTQFQKNISTDAINVDKIRKKFKLSVNVPKEFKLVLEKDNFFWFKKEIQSGNQSLLLYEIPISAIDADDAVADIVKIRDSVGALYIHGTMEHSKMATEDSYMPYLFATEVDHKKTYQTKGNWELKNDFMSGPFVNYCIIDLKNNRILVIEGFSYAPSTPKRDLMFELDAIIKTIQF
ncbi:DUF4837 family protein [Flavobacterium sp. NST-5]|uniref:DUF4837 family protein n=1 Tax=Flavobacterium ichthyis TaxID=2698827 RepID=A0ABW9ZG51_9FLAO|nr:DUF4837 family protein [Flavobacterium ichthyis]NBL65743.1 DUF4837 family protein [Flavobacterium ichthyis]